MNGPIIEAQRRKVIPSAVAALAFNGMVATAHATPLITANTTDNVYGDFSGSIPAGTTGAAAELT
jgi:hypothetical protein